METSLSEKDRCVTAQILDSCRVSVAVRPQHKIYNGLLLSGRKQLLLDRLVPTRLAAVVAVPLSGTREGIGRCNKLAGRNGLASIARYRHDVQRELTALQGACHVRCDAYYAVKSADDTESEY